MKKVALFISASVLAFSFSAYAQNTSAGDDRTETKNAGLEDIIVTAQRRDESAQRAAVAIDVLGGDDMRDAGITQPDRLGEMSPALTVQGTSVGNIFFIRGVGNFTLSPNSDPATAFNYDGVYLGRPTATGGTFFDLQRVEVLKGPQGTLYGRNATAGAINVIPVRPVPGEFSGYGSVSYGNYEARQAEGALNLPMGKNGAMRVSGNFVRRDGYLRDGTNDEKTEGVRVQLMSELTPKLTVRLSGDYSHNGGFGGSLSYDSNYRYDSAAGRYVRSLSGLPISEGLGTPEADLYRQTLPAGPPGRNLGPLDFTPHQNNFFYGAHTEIAYETGIGTITILPAWRYADLDYVSTAGGFGFAQVETDEQFSLEVRLAGNRVGPVDYILGGYYYHETIDLNSTANFSASTNFTESHFRTRSLAPFGRLTLHLNDALRLVGGARYTKDRKSFRGMGTSGTIICNVIVSGVRRCPTAPLFTLVDSPSDLTIPFPIRGGAPVPLGSSGAIVVRTDSAFDSRLSKGRVTYRGAVEFDVGPASLLYGSIETGFRSGGFSSAVGFETYEPEYITAYTIGMKNRFFGNRLQLNLEAFRWLYRNQQVSAVTLDLTGRSGLITQNIGFSRIQGVEVSARAAVTPTTVLSADVQYLDTENRSFTYQQANQGTPPLTGCPAALAPGGRLYNVNCAGFPAFNSPRWTLNLAAEQTLPLGDYQFVVAANTQYRSKRYVGFAYLDAQLVPSSWQSNIQLSFGPENQRWSLAAFVRNIENKRIIAYSYTHPFAGSVANGSSAPRTYGLRTNIKF
jgi:iron complex outermembrane receptor protein